MYSNGDFAEATDSDDNVFIKDGFLQIQPTLQDENLINKNNIVDLTKQGCIGTKWTDCHAVTNITNGTIVPPARSARLITKGGLNIQYGRVEVEAQLPEGDWLWPAIWMMPEDDTYGEWPNSGEIDIMESRGNNHTYKMGGNNVASSALHWGPTQALDAWYKTNNHRDALHTTYTQSKSARTPPVASMLTSSRNLDVWSGKLLPRNLVTAFVLTFTTRNGQRSTYSPTSMGARTRYSTRHLTSHSGRKASSSLNKTTTAL